MGLDISLFTKLDPDTREYHDCCLCGGVGIGEGHSGLYLLHSHSVCEPCLRMLWTAPDETDAEMAEEAETSGTVDWSCGF